MAFTGTESGKCSVLLAEKIMRNNAFHLWNFIIIDSYGNRYEWQESHSYLNYSAEPTDTEVLTYIDSYLTGGSHAVGGGNYSSVAPTQSTETNKPKTSIRKPNVFGRVPAGEPAPPGSPN